MSENVVRVHGKLSGEDNRNKKESFRKVYVHAL